MNKSCYICKHSVEVKYSEKCPWGIEKCTTFFCIAAPPTPLDLKNSRLSVSLDKVTNGCKELHRYRYYPIVATSYEEVVAPCSLYFFTDSKIEKYKKMIEEQKKDRQRRKEEQKKKVLETKRLQKIVKAKRAREVLETKQRREKIRLEAKRKKHRRKYQKEYRKRKKTVEAKILAEALELDSRFDILDL